MKQRKHATRRRVVLVVGPPRSGTSAACQALAGLGVHFGDPSRFVDPEKNTHNPIFFELQSLNDLNDALLAAATVNFGDFDYYPEPGVLVLSDEQWQAFEKRAEALLAEELHGPVIGLKDPRFVFTLPFWERFFKDRGFNISYVFVVRAARSIALSNAKVNKCGEAHNDRLAWLSLHLCAAQLVGRRPVLLDFDQLVSDPEEVIAGLAKSLKLTRVKEHRHGIDSGLKHETDVRHFNDADIGEMAKQYLERRAEMERTGLLELLDRRRNEVAGLLLSNRALSQEVENANATAGLSERRLESALVPLIDELRNGFDRLVGVMASAEDEKGFSRSIVQQRIRDLEEAFFSKQAEIVRISGENLILQARLDGAAAGSLEPQETQEPVEVSPKGDAMDNGTLSLDPEVNEMKEAGSATSERLRHPAIDSKEKE